MSGIFLFYKLAITSGQNMFYLHFLIKLLSSNKKYWSAAKNLVPVLKGAIQVIFYYMKSFRKSKRKKKN